MLSPFHVVSLLPNFSLSYWTWLNNRNFCVDKLFFLGKDAGVQDIVNHLPNIDDTNKKKSLSTEWTEIKNIKISYFNSLKILNSVKSLEIKYSDDQLMMKLSMYCYNLKSLNLYKYDTAGSGLISLLRVNFHTLTELSLLKCLHYAESVSSLVMFLSNIRKLVVLKSEGLLLDIWYPMSMSLSKLTNLTLDSISVAVWRKSVLNIINLKYLTITILEEENDDFKDLFPQSLVELNLSWYFHIIDMDLKNIMAFNQLTNLRVLTTSTSGVFYDTEILSTSIPVTLTQLNISELYYLSDNKDIRFQDILFVLPYSLTQINLTNCAKFPIGIAKLISSSSTCNPKLEIRHSFS
eukprot:gene12405-16638_t